MELDSIGFSTYLDTTGVTLDYNRLERQFANKYFKVKVSVDDRALTDLNKHFDLKEKHHARLQSKFDRNPLTPRTNTKELDGLFDILSGDSKLTIDVNHKATINNIDFVGGMRETNKFLKNITKNTRPKSILGNAINLTLGNALKGVFQKAGEEFSKNVVKQSQRTEKGRNAKKQLDNIALRASDISINSLESISDLFFGGYKKSGEAIEQMGNDILDVVETFSDPAVFVSRLDKSRKYLINLGTKIESGTLTLDKALQDVFDNLFDLNPRFSRNALFRTSQVAATPYKLRKEFNNAKLARTIELFGDDLEKLHRSLKQYPGYFELLDGKIKNAVITFGGFESKKGAGSQELSAKLAPFFDDQTVFFDIKNNRTDKWSGDKNPQAKDVINQIANDLGFGDIQGDIMSTIANIETTLMAGLKGVNPDAVRGAIVNYALKQLFPDLNVGAVSFSGGYKDLEQMVSIMEMLGTDTKGLSIGAPIVGLTNTASANNYKSALAFSDEQSVGIDKLVHGLSELENELLALAVDASGKGVSSDAAKYQLFRGSENLEFIDNKKIRHDIQSYLNDPTFRKMLLQMLPGVKDISGDINKHKNKLSKELQEKYADLIDLFGDLDLETVKQFDLKPFIKAAKTEAIINPKTQGRTVDDIQKFLEIPREDRTRIQQKFINEFFKSATESLRSLVNTGSEVKPTKYNTYEELAGKKSSEDQFYTINNIARLLTTNGNRLNAFAQNRGIDTSNKTEMKALEKELFSFFQEILGTLGFGDHLVKNIDKANKLLVSIAKDVEESNKIENFFAKSDIDSLSSSQKDSLLQLINFSSNDDSKLAKGIDIFLKNDSDIPDSIADFAFFDYSNPLKALGAKEQMGQFAGIDYHVIKPIVENLQGTALEDFANGYRHLWLNIRKIMSQYIVDDVDVPLDKLKEYQELLLSRDYQGIAKVKDDIPGKSFGHSDVADAIKNKEVVAPYEEKTNNLTHDQIKELARLNKELIKQGKKYISIKDAEVIGTGVHGTAILDKENKRVIKIMSQVADPLDSIITGLEGLDDSLGLVTPILKLLIKPKVDDTDLFRQEQNNLVKASQAGLIDDSGLNSVIPGFVIMPEVQGNILFDKAKNVDPSQVESIHEFIENIIEAGELLNTIHDKGFTHGDFHLGNIIKNDSGLNAIDFSYLENINKDARVARQQKSKEFNIAVEKIFNQLRENGINVNKSIIRKALKSGYDNLNKNSQKILDEVEGRFLHEAAVKSPTPKKQNPLKQLKTKEKATEAEYKEKERQKEAQRTDVFELEPSVEQELQKQTQLLATLIDNIATFSDKINFSDLTNIQDNIANNIATFSDKINFSDLINIQDNIANNIAVLASSELPIEADTSSMDELTQINKQIAKDFKQLNKSVKKVNKSVSSIDKEIKSGLINNTIIDAELQFDEPSSPNKGLLAGTKQFGGDLVAANINPIIKAGQTIYGAAEIIEDVAFSFVGGKLTKNVVKSATPVVALTAASVINPEIGAAMGGISNAVHTVSTPLLQGGANLAADAMGASGIAGTITRQLLGAGAGAIDLALPGFLTINTAKLVVDKVAGTAKNKLLPQSTQKLLASSNVSDQTKAFLGDRLNRIRANKQSFYTLEAQIENIQDPKQLAALIENYNRNMRLFYENVEVFKQLEGVKGNQNLLSSIGGTSKGITGSRQRFLKGAYDKAKTIDADFKVVVDDPKRVRKQVKQDIKATDNTSAIVANWEKTEQAVKKNITDLEKHADKLGYEIQKDLSEGSPGITQNIRKNWLKTQKYVTKNILEIVKTSNLAGSFIEDKLTADFTYLDKALTTEFPEAEADTTELQKAKKLLEEIKAIREGIATPGNDLNIAFGNDAGAKATTGDIEKKLERFISEQHRLEEILSKPEIKQEVESSFGSIEEFINKINNDAVIGSPDLSGLNDASAELKQLYLSTLDIKAGWLELVKLAKNYAQSLDEDPLGGLTGIKDAYDNLIGNLPDTGSLVGGIGDVISELRKVSPVMGSILDTGKAIGTIFLAGFGIHELSQYVREFGRGSLEAARNQERFISVMEGVGRNGSQVYEDLAERSLKIGANFDSAKEGYSRFFLATQGTGGDKIIDPVFSGFQKALVARRANQDKQSRAFTALEQMLSSGLDSNVMSEELRLQLSDALSGSFATAALVRGQNTRELREDLKEARVEVEDLLTKMSAFYEVDSELQLRLNAQTFDAELERAITNIELVQASLGQGLLWGSKQGLRAFNAGLGIAKDNAYSISVLVAGGLAKGMWEVVKAVGIVNKQLKITTILSKATGFESISNTFVANKQQGFGNIRSGVNTAGSLVGGFAKAVAPLAAFTLAVYTAEKAVSYFQAGLNTRFSESEKIGKEILADKQRKLNPDLFTEPQSKYKSGNPILNSLAYIASGKSGTFSKKMLEKSRRDAEREGIVYKEDEGFDFLALDTGKRVKELTAFKKNVSGLSDSFRGFLTTVDPNDAQVQANKQIVNDLDAEIGIKKAERMNALRNKELDLVAKLDKDIAELNSKRFSAFQVVGADLSAVKQYETQIQGLLDAFEGDDKTPGLKVNYDEKTQQEIREQLSSDLEQAKITIELLEIEAAKFINEDLLIRQVTDTLGQVEFGINLAVNQASINNLQRRLNGEIGDSELELENSKANKEALTRASFEYAKLKNKLAYGLEDSKGFEQLQIALDVSGKDELLEKLKTLPTETLDAIANDDGATPELKKSIELAKQLGQVREKSLANEKQRLEEQRNIVQQTAEIQTRRLLRPLGNIQAGIQGSITQLGIEQTNSTLGINDDVLSGKAGLSSLGINKLTTELDNLNKVLAVRKTGLSDVTGQLNKFSAENQSEVANLLGIKGNLADFAQNSSPEVIDSLVENLSGAARTAIADSGENTALVEVLKAIATSSEEYRQALVSRSESQIQLKQELLGLQSNFLSMIDSLENQALESIQGVISFDRQLEDFAYSIEDYNYNLKESIFTIGRQAQELKAAIASLKLGGLSSYFEGANISNILTEFFSSIGDITSQASSIRQNNRAPELEQEQRRQDRDFSRTQRDNNRQIQDINLERQSKSIQNNQRIRQLQQENKQFSDIEIDGEFARGYQRNIQSQIEQVNRTVVEVLSRASQSGVSANIGQVQNFQPFSPDELENSTPEQFSDWFRSSNNEMINILRQVDQTEQKILAKRTDEIRRNLAEQTELYREESAERAKIIELENQKEIAETENLVKKIQGIFDAFDGNIKLAVDTIELETLQQSLGNQNILSGLFGTLPSDAFGLGQAEARIQVEERILELKRKQNELNLLLKKSDDVVNNPQKFISEISKLNIDENVKGNIISQLQNAETTEQIRNILASYKEQLQNVNSQLQEFELNQDAIEQRAGDLRQRRTDLDRNSTIFSQRERGNSAYNASNRLNSIEQGQNNRVIGLQRIDQEYESELLELEKLKGSLGEVTAEYSKAKQYLDTWKAISISNLIQETDYLGSSFRDSLSVGLRGFLDEFKDGVDGIDELWKAFALGVLETWSNVLTQLAQQQLMKVLLGDSVAEEQNYQTPNFNLFRNREERQNSNFAIADGFNLFGNNNSSGFSTENEESFTGFTLLDEGTSDNFTAGINDNLSHYKQGLEGNILSIFQNVMSSSGGQNSGGFWGGLLKTGVGLATSYFTKGGSSAGAAGGTGAGAAGAGSFAFARMGMINDVPNFRSGNLNNPISLWNGYQKAMKKEAHPNAFPAVLHKGEIVLSDLTGDAQKFNHMLRSGAWEAYEPTYNKNNRMLSEMSNYRYGSVVTPTNNNINNSSRSSNVTHNWNFSGSNYEGFRQNQASILRRAQLEERRNQDRNG